MLIIHGYIELMRRKEVYLKLMQDGAPGHRGGETKKELEEHEIIVIYWPPYSPDLNILLI